MLCDFNVCASDATCATFMITELIRLGYDAAAFTTEVDALAVSTSRQKKSSSSKDGKLKPLVFQPLTPVTMTAESKRAHECRSRRSFKQISRLTVTCDNISDVFWLNWRDNAVASFDLLAVRPENDQCSRRLGFRMKFPTVNAALERGVHFEICYAPALNDSTARRNLISNAIDLLRVTKGRCLIISSEARRVMELRGPYDISNLALLFGFNGHAAGKEAISTNCQRVLKRAETRRTTYKSAVSMRLISDLDASEGWKLAGTLLQADCNAPMDVDDS